MTRRSPFDVPIATYRLQFRKDFTFDQAREVVPYLAKLGVSHVYASPFLKARAGSTHGYDVVDHTQLNPELGTRESFEKLCAALREHEMGLIADIVPNHMGIGKADNPWWLDVLEWGPMSRYSDYFDIDWKPPRSALADKVLLPILGQVYGAALKAGEIELRLDAAEGTFSFWYFDHRLPVGPRDYPEILAAPIASLADSKYRPLRDAAELLREVTQSPAPTNAAAARTAADMVKRRFAAALQERDFARLLDSSLAAWRGRPGESESFSRLHELLQRQAYRLAYWRVASDEINYRRFFDINDLAGIRMEGEQVFEDTHRFLGELISAGLIHGLRVDHVDGLADPEDYCRRLNAFVQKRLARAGAGARRPYIIVEKILAHHERLREGWAISGTTGYDYLALANGLFIDPATQPRMERIWRRFSGFSATFGDELYRCRRLIIDTYLTSELAVLTNLLVQIAEADWFTRDFTRQRLRAAIAETVAAFPVYRTYVTERGIDDADMRDIIWAIEQAKKRWTGTDVEVLGFVRSVLTLEVAKTSPAHYEVCREVILHFVARFQQYTGAVAAKAFEDTLFYRYIPLLSANEVGSDPRHAGTSLEAFHQTIAARSRRFPHGMLASETHDTKRAEDARARLNVLSELTDDWSRRAARWRMLNRYKLVELDDGVAPTPDDEFLIYQTVLGSWPTEIVGMTSTDRLGPYVERLKSYAVKASREAKIATSWTLPNERYENAISIFIDRIFAISSRNPFLESVLRIAPRVSLLGAMNSLSQLVLRATVPGVPDFYQGSELWDLSMVDPDNRRPVDFAARCAALQQVAALKLSEAKARWRDGLLKLWLMAALLKLRNAEPALFADGSFHRLAIEGDAQDNVIGYSRRFGETEIAVIVGRLLARKLNLERLSFWPNGEAVKGSFLRGTLNSHFVDVLSGASIVASEHGLALEQVLHALPVAVLKAA